MLNLSLKFPLSALIFLSLAARGQNPADAFNRAPAGVEDSLRGRITAFYALHKDGKFRQAESYVCSDSKDAFYDLDKRRWSKLEIIKINFENDFKSAKVLVALGTELKSRGQTVPATYPLNTFWQLESGQWCNQLPPLNKTETITPFGIMRQTDVPNPETSAPRPTGAIALGSIKFSKRSLKVKGYESSSDELEVYNGLPGAITVDVQSAELPGLKWSLNKKTLNAGDRATLKVVYEPPDKSPKPEFVLRLLVEPMGQATPIPVVFDIPEETKKQLPPSVQKQP